MKRKHITKCLVAVASLMGLVATSSMGGTFTNDFNNLQLDPNDPDKILPPDGTVFLGRTAAGIAAGYDHRTGGQTGGAVKITTASNGQGGGFIVHNFDGAAAPVAFDMRFHVLFGGGTDTPADGMALPSAISLTVNSAKKARAPSKG
jgi:hypothetical protein